MNGMRHLLLLGGGHAHVEVLRRLGASPLAGWRVTLLTREAMSPYSGMLPGVIAGLYEESQALIDVRALAARCGAEALIDRVTGIDLAAKQVMRAEGAPVPWDLLSIDTGATPDTSRVPGAATHAIALKPIDALLPRLRGLLGEAKAGQRIAVVGAGAAGSEVALALAARLRPRGVEVVLVAGASGLLPGFPEKLRHRMEAALAARGVALRQGENVAEVFAEGLGFGRIPPLAADAVLWAAGAAAAPWLGQTGLLRDSAGFLRVDPCLRAIGRQDVFVAGDAASFDESPLPKAGVFAVRQGPVLALNLRAAADGKAPKPYEPQKDFLVLLSLGDGRALGTRSGFVFGGRWVWWLKDRIDRRFMARYHGARYQEA